MDPRKHNVKGLLSRLQVSQAVNQNLIRLAGHETALRKRALMALHPPQAETPAQRLLLEINARWAEKMADAKTFNSPFADLYHALTPAECAEFEKAFPEQSLELQLQLLRDLDPEKSQPEISL